MFLIQSGTFGGFGEVAEVKENNDFAGDFLTWGVRKSPVCVFHPKWYLVIFTKCYELQWFLVDFPDRRGCRDPLWDVPGGMRRACKRILEIGDIRGY